VQGRPWMSLLRGQALLTPDGAVEQKPGYGALPALLRATLAGAAS
jgi:hypothetical protein